MHRSHDEPGGSSAPIKLFGSRSYECEPRDIQIAEPQSERVEEVARLMEVREFEVFCRAWRDWHGSPPQLKQIEPYVVRFEHFGELPPWLIAYLEKKLPLAVWPQAPKTSLWRVGKYLRRVESSFRGWCGQSSKGRSLFDSLN